MQVFRTSNSLQEFLAPLKKTKKIGFVPTMGALHQGHLSLVKQGLEENNIVVVSVFVNPTQFDNATDLKKYPRMLEQDIALLKTLSGDVVVFSPEASDLYGGTIESTHYKFGGLANEMEGKHRKGHFDGVGTVLNLLFRAVQPNVAYFGKKDFQQLQIVKKLVALEKLPVTITGCEIVREPNGVAMSSRNKRLSKIQLEEAILISESLKAARKDFSSNSIAAINKMVAERFAENLHLELEYFEIANEKDLKTAVRKTKGVQYRGFIAAFIGGVRLIDNMSLN